MRIGIRVDANSSIGWGHLARSRSFAIQALKEDCEVAFFGQLPFSELLELDAIYHCSTNEQELFTAISAFNPDWLLFDGYHFSPDLTAPYAELDCSIAFIDDLATGFSIPCELVLSPAGDRFRDELVRLYPQSRVLTGYPFVFIHPAFLSAGKFFSQRNNLLVSFGGSDVKGLTQPVVEALLQAGFENISLVITAAMSLPKAWLAELPVTLYQDLTPVEMAAVMAEAKLAVVAAGSTMFELSAMGVPFVSCVVADNQLNAAQAYQALLGGDYVDCRGGMQISELMTTLSELDDSALAEQHKKVKKLIDGKGAQRVLEAMRDYE